MAGLSASTILAKTKAVASSAICTTDRITVLSWPSLESMNPLRLSALPSTYSDVRQTQTIISRLLIDAQMALVL